MFRGNLYNDERPNMIDEFKDMGKRVKQRFSRRNDKCWADKAKRIQTAVDTTGVKVLNQPFERCFHGSYPLQWNLSVQMMGIILFVTPIANREDGVDIWMCDWIFLHQWMKEFSISFRKDMLIRSWTFFCRLVRQMLLSCGRSSGLGNICSAVETMKDEVSLNAYFV